MSLLKFDDFVNEAKKNWIKDVDMKKGALKKDLKKDKITPADLKKEEAKLKKKDKDKKKPGLQLDKKDAKKHKRLTLAKNLMKASGKIDESASSEIKGIKDSLIEIHKVIDEMIKKTGPVKGE